MFVYQLSDCEFESRCSHLMKISSRCLFIRKIPTTTHCNLCKIPQSSNTSKENPTMTHQYHWTARNMPPLPPVKTWQPTTLHKGLSMTYYYMGIPTNNHYHREILKSTPYHPKLSIKTCNNPEPKNTRKLNTTTLKKHNNRKQPKKTHKTWGLPAFDNHSEQTHTIHQHP